MLLLKQIQKRKAKKLYGYVFVFIGIFCIVLFLAFGEFVITRGKQGFASPLGSWESVTLGKNKSSAIVNQINTVCSKYQLSCENISQDSNDSATLHIGDKIITLSLRKNIEQEIASLQLTIKQLTMEGKEFHRLDFRYDRPVISP